MATPRRLRLLRTRSVLPTFGGRLDHWVEDCFLAVRARGKSQNGACQRIKSCKWRRESDSNPRYSFPHTRFPSVRLKPLGHLSGKPSLEAAGGFLQAGHARRTRFLPNSLMINGILWNT